MYTYNNQEVQLPNFEMDDTYKGALDVLKWAYAHYGESLIYACSFGIEGSLLIDLISKVKSNAQIVFLDTDKHFKETYDTIERVKEKYPALQITLKKPRLTLQQQAQQFGEELWYTNPNSCCSLRKIEPLQETLAGANAWLSGLRREQSETRAHVEFVNVDHKFQSIKICPLIHWTWKDVWRYVAKHEVPYNILHDQGYPSIGCETCTKPAFTIDDLRSGRWSGAGKIECGLHT